MRFIGINNIKLWLPMKISTPRPKARTLDIIRQIAYTYQPNVNKAYSLN